MNIGCIVLWVLDIVICNVQPAGNCSTSRRILFGYYFCFIVSIFDLSPIKRCDKSSSHNVFKIRQQFFGRLIPGGFGPESNTTVVDAIHNAIDYPFPIDSTTIKKDQFIVVVFLEGVIVSGTLSLNCVEQLSVVFFAWECLF